MLVMNSFGWIDDTHHEKKDTKLHRCLSTVGGAEGRWISVKIGEQRLQVMLNSALALVF